MVARSITIEFDDDNLTRYTDQHLAMLWHLTQHNPAPIQDRPAGELTERVGREIIRRFVRAVEPELWSHQGRHHYALALSAVATYQPGGPSGSEDWYRGTWAPKTAEIDDSSKPE